MCVLPEMKNQLGEFFFFYHYWIQLRLCYISVSL